MSTITSSSSDVESVRAELHVARNEIKNLRKQIATLSQVHRKDVQHIVETLANFRADNYQPDAAVAAAATRSPTASPALQAPAGTTFQPIGFIRTVFAEKRAVPRQPTVGATLLGCVQLNDEAFTNPEHALHGLHEFSHMWLIYHFHRNAPSSRAKVAPPRLNGERVGVFSTRSPHRPCPIGLSLVEVHKIDGARIYFRGTDMVDGTPVLDIKPYIPLYDNPLQADGDVTAGGGVAGAQATAQRGVRSLPQLSSREEPDGEESDGAVGGIAAGGGAVDDADGVGVGAMAVGGTTPRASAVRVPDWIMAAPTLEVWFNERAEAELAELGVDRASIVDVMSADPRSVYIRTKYGSQIFTFQLGAVAVTCKFDDPAARVTIVRIRRTENLPAQDD